MKKPDFVRMARDMADDVTKSPSDGIAALAVMSEYLKAAYTDGLLRAAEISDEAIIVAVEVNGDFQKGVAFSEIAAAIRAYANGVEI